MPIPDLLGSPPIARVRSTLDALWRRVRGGGRTEPPPRAEVGTALDAVNDSFHEAYEQGRTVERRAQPVFVVLADSLVFFRGDERTEYEFSPREFHVIKSVAHAPVALYALLEASASTSPSPSTSTSGGGSTLAAKVEALRAKVRDSLRSLDGEDALEPGVRDDCREVLTRTLAHLDEREALHDAAARDAFAESLGAPLLRLIRAATSLQLNALHAHTEEALRTLSPDERASLEVVVTGDHQARERALGMQYFGKRLGEPDGIEHRVTYAEGVSDEASALALIGTRRLDREVARAFFGDAHRLQRDVLGDASRDLLAKSDLTPI